MEVTWVIAFFLLTVLFWSFKYHWSRRHLYVLANKLSGPPALPVVGNGLLFLGKTEKMLSVIMKITREYHSPIRIWLGPILVVYLTKPEHLEKVLSSSKMANKHYLYKLVKIFLGDGILTANGQKWKSHRKIIQPHFNLKFVMATLDIFQKHVNKCIEKLQVQEGKRTFDIEKYLHKCVTDIIGDTVFATEMNAQDGENADFIEATILAYDLVYCRLVKPWFHSDTFFRFSKLKPLQDRYLELTTSFTEKIVKNSWKKTLNKSPEEREESEKNPATPIVDRLTQFLVKNPDAINDTDLKHQMLTLYLASEDTIALIASSLCVCFGMYPEYQQRAAEEIRSIFGDSPREIFYEDLTKMEYIGRCIKDVLRLMPIAPFIIRQPAEDFPFENIVLTKDVAVVVGIYAVHHDPEHWERPHEFHPDHFLPEQVQKRHPFAYVPFSAGPRSCIGKIFGTTSVKIIIAHMLQRYEIEADGKFPDIKLRADISTRFADGYNVRLKPRVW